MILVYAVCRGFLVLLDPLVLPARRVLQAVANLGHPVNPDRRELPGLRRPNRLTHPSHPASRSRSAHLPELMSNISTEPLSESWKVLLWRQEELERAGYPVHLAMDLAERVDVDLHQACALLERGATIAEALRILS